MNFLFRWKMKHSQNLPRQFSVGGFLLVGWLGVFFIVVLLFFFFFLNIRAHEGSGKCRLV